MFRVRQVEGEFSQTNCLPLDVSGIRFCEELPNMEKIWDVYLYTVRCVNPLMLDSCMTAKPDVISRSTSLSNSEF